MTVVWTEALSVQVKELDDQHKEFIKIMNSLYPAISSFDLKKEVDHIIDQLIHFAGYHFATEENYFDKFKYSGAEEHKKQHQDLTAKVMEFKNSELDPATKAMELMTFLEKWFIGHEHEYDQKYIECFHNHGLY